MFILISTYLVDSTEMAAHRPDHLAWVEEHFAAGRILMAGRREGSVGGVIVADLPGRAALDAFLSGDPYVERGVARYEIEQFDPGFLAGALRPSAP